ncbi:MAG: prepilin-type N-terminal cleavage/methylation domain-containing protein [Deltaproteobacteria bacterium]|nr:prepilin-type N-terminal cleavage/methylation domain-containing protein [Deltaproteobacteria bacterium]
MSVRRLQYRSAMNAGFSLLELMWAVLIAGVLAAVAVPSFVEWRESQQLRDSALAVSSAFSYARSEAVRTGNIHLVLFQRDAQGTLLSGSPILVVDDGRPASSDQNCSIDSAEPSKQFFLGDNVTFGLTNASGTVSTDAGASTITNGSTFEDAAGNAATWVLFRPEGPPRAFSSDCTAGSIGSGGGGIYLTNGDRNTAVVLTPLGASRTHRWLASSASWSS